MHNWIGLGLRLYLSDMSEDKEQHQLHTDVQIKTDCLTPYTIDWRSSRKLG